MKRSTLKLYSCYKHTETGSSLHRWLLWVFLALLLTNPIRESQDCPRFPSHVSTGSVQTELHGSSCWQPAWPSAAWISQQYCAELPAVPSSVLGSPGIFFQPHLSCQVGARAGSKFCPESGPEYPRQAAQTQLSSQRTKLASRAPCKNK